MSGRTKRPGREPACRVFVDKTDAANHDAADDTGAFIIQESVGYLLAVNARLFQREMTLRLAKHGVAHAQFAIILVLWAGDGLTQRDLSRRVAIEEPTLARALSRMEKEKLVRRERDAADARQVLVFLTKRSRALRDHLVPLAIAMQERAMAVLTEAERMILIVLLRKVWEANRTKDDDPPAAQQDDDDDR